MDRQDLLAVEIAAACLGVTWEEFATVAIVELARQTIEKRLNRMMELGLMDTPGGEVVLDAWEGVGGLDHARCPGMVKPWLEAQGS